jgi:hypothetical protein
LSSNGLIRKAVISIASGVSRRFFQRKKAFTWPDFLSSSLSGHGSESSHKIRML